MNQVPGCLSLCIIKCTPLLYMFQSPHIHKSLSGKPHLLLELPSDSRWL